MTVVVGVDGAGRTHRLDEIVAAASRPGGPVAIRIDPPLGTVDELAIRLSTARAEGCLVVVDDAHRLAADLLLTLTAAARQGLTLVIARRPTIDSRELAELDEAVAAKGSIEQLRPLDVDGVAALVASVTGRPCPPARAAEIHAASAGLPAVAAAVALAPPGAPPDAPSPALVARVQRRLAVLDPGTATIARILALRVELVDAVVAVAADVGVDRLAAGVRALRDEGLLVPDGEAMIPAVADAILADLPPAERRRIHDAVARAMVDAGSDLGAAATQLRAARAFTPNAAEVYRATGDRLRFTDPAAALGWYDDALDAGAEPPAVAAGRAEAAALLGLSLDSSADAAAADASRFALVDGATAAHQGRAARAAEVLVAAGPPGPVLAVASLMGIGRPADAGRAARATPGPRGLQRFAAAVLAVAEPQSAVPLLIEAAELLESMAPTVVLPDTPHAVGAVVAVMAGDAATAEHLLDRALAAGVGGPVAAERHRLLLAWVRMRIGRYDTAVAELRRLAEASLPGRERLLLAALAAGIARRSGDIARLRDAWTGAEPALARLTVDLFATETLEELLVAAIRLRRPQRVAPVLGELDSIVAGLGRPAAWAVAVGWIRLQLAIAEEDGAAAETAARELGALTVTGPRQRAQCAAAPLWAGAISGAVEPDAILAAADDLAAAELPWEASRLVGHAAIRTTDAAAARRMLERARELSSLDVAAADGRPDSVGGLSEREVEVGRMVLAGSTYREIGSRLFISPKTVEHHVARIRTKLGATTRAEFLAALRAVLDGSDQH